MPDIVGEVFDELAVRTGRRYALVDYIGAADAERVIVLMGSAAGAATEAVETMTAAGERVGLLTVRLYRPFPAEAMLAALPPTTRSIAVLDRTKEPGAVGEPLYLDVVAALSEAAASGRLPLTGGMPRVIGGRYGLSSKEVTPSHIAGVFNELAEARPKVHFTVGIHDDVTRLSLEPDRTVRYARPAGEVQAMFFGLGSDGTVGANKSSIKIIGEETDLFAQGYFVYDSKKSGSVTVSHLRFGPEPIRSTYLIDDADFVACHQFGLLEKLKILEHARPGATFLLNSPWSADEVWDHLPMEVQEELIAKHIDMWVIDADRVAARCADGQPHQHGHAAVLLRPLRRAPRRRGDRPDQGVRREERTAARGQAIVERNFAAIDASLAALHRVEIPQAVTTTVRREHRVPDDAPDFVKRVTALLMAGDGDLLPVSALPVDGMFPTGTAQYEKRAIAQEIPIFDPDICIDCGQCAIVCPHATIRMKVYDPSALAGAPEGFRSKEFRSKDISGIAMTIQVAPDDCTGCGVCVDVCPAKSKSEVRHKAINMEPAAAHREVERQAWDFFLSIPELDRDVLPHDSVKGSQALQPLFEFSGACAGCGETPYIKLATQLFGDRMIVANATGCSSIYGANLPTTPWTANAEGRGPAWSNSLFEDNAEFGLGMRLGYEAQQRHGAAAARAGWPRSSAPTWRPRSSPPIRPTSRASGPSVSASPRCRPRSAPLAATDEHHGAAVQLADRRRCPGPHRASGSSVATGGPTTSASVASTTCCRSAATSTSSCSTPRCTRTPAARRRRRPPAARSPSSPPAARASARRTWARSPAPTATSTWPRSPSAPTTSRPRRRCWRPTPGPGPASSSPTRRASPTASTCRSR